MARNFNNCIKISDPNQLKDYFCNVKPTDSYYPLQHWDFYKLAETSLNRTGVGFKDVEFGITTDFARAFMWAETDTMVGGQPLYIGGRNSMDKSMSAGLCIGTKITVCSNKVIASYKNGGVALRKHSSEENIDQLGFQFEALVTDTVAEGNDTNLCTFFHQLDLLKHRNITHQEVKALLTDLYLLKSIQARDIPPIWDQFLYPRHPEFNERTAYNFVMACTEVFKTHQGVDYQINAYDTLARLMHL
jgi:hypothetical protein